MSNYAGKKYFVIHANDAGSEAYTDQYTNWLERQVREQTAQIEELLEACERASYVLENTFGDGCATWEERESQYEDERNCIEQLDALVAKFKAAKPENER